MRMCRLACVSGRVHFARRHTPQSEVLKPRCAEQAKKREGELATKVSSMESEMQTYQTQAQQAMQTSEELKAQLAVRSLAFPANGVQNVVGIACHAGV